MKAPRVDHVGIIVEAMEPAVAVMRKMLPGAPVRHRSMPEVGLEVTEFLAENIIVELLHYTTQQPSLARLTMGSAMGMNHLSVSVPDIDAALLALAADGIEPVAGFPRQGAHGRIAFLDYDLRTAMRIELCQPEAAANDEDLSHG